MFGGKGGTETISRPTGGPTGGPGKAARKDVLRVEVLTHDAIRRMASEEAVKEGRYYRVRDRDREGLLTLAEVKDLIRTHRKVQRLDILLASDNDHPAPGVGSVTVLRPPPSPKSCGGNNRRLDCRVSVGWLVAGGWWRVAGGGVFSIHPPPATLHQPPATSHQPPATRHPIPLSTP